MLLTFEEMGQVLPTLYKQSLEINNLLFDIKKFLKNKTHEQIQIIQNTFDYEIEAYYCGYSEHLKAPDETEPELEYYQILEQFIHNGYLFKEWQDYELFAVLSYYYLNSFIRSFSSPIKYNGYDDLLCAWETLRLADRAYFMNTMKKQELDKYLQEEIAQKARSENARKAGLNKRSQYEKMGTIHAVNTLLDEKQDLLQQRGGKAALCRMILDLITENQITALNTPTERTVEMWIAKYIETKSTS